MNFAGDYKLSEKIFWEQIEALIKLPANAGRNRLIATAELEDLQDAIDNVFGDRQASNFIKICAHLKTPDVHGVATAIQDLASHNWMFEETLEKQMASKREKDGWRGYSTYVSQRYDRYPRVETDEIKSFLKQNFIRLTAFQKERLGSTLKDKPRHQPHEFNI